MDQVKIKVIIDGKVKYFAHKDEKGIYYLQDKKRTVSLLNPYNAKTYSPK